MWPNNCHCFSMCNDKEVARFVSLRPSTINSTDSPWVGYLREVYGHQPLLPFSLSALNFFYHRDKNWPANVEWPMPPCIRLHTGSPAVRNSTTHCSEAQCARWWADTPEPLKTQHSVVFPNGPLVKGHPTRGTAFWQKAINLTAEELQAYGPTVEELPGHASAANGTWLEVMRMSERVMPALLFATNGHTAREGENNCTSDCTSN